MSQKYGGSPNYKRTTDKQYSLLKHKMAILAQKVKKDNRKSYKHEFWADVTEKLNEMGPPFRNLQQWKKVWSDFRRCQRIRKSKINFECQKNKIKYEIDNNNEINQHSEEEEEEDEVQDEESTQTRYKNTTSKRIKNEVEMNNDNMDMTTYSNDYDNDDYSYPDEPCLEEGYIDDNQPFLIDETSCSSYNYVPPKLQRPPQPPAHQQSSVKRAVGVQNFSSPSPALPAQSLPPLRPLNSHLLDQTLYTLQNQMEHQTKLLEHLSQISGTMAKLMERQVNAVEKQTEAIRRQASATEHHTLIMNRFIDMIHEKMLKSNAKKATETNLTTDIL